MEIKKENNKIWIVGNKKEEKFLRTSVKDFDFSMNKPAIENVVNHIRTMMYKYGGVGLSANQIGLNIRVFVAQLPNERGDGYKGKFYVVFNPVIDSFSKKEYYDTEGCLSIPKTYGVVSRCGSIKINGNDKNGKNISIKAKGFLARVFQHEVDHLNGVLFTDKAKEIKKIDEL